MNQAARTAVLLEEGSSFNDCGYTRVRKKMFCFLAVSAISKVYIRQKSLMI